MNKVKGSFTLALVATLGLACGGSGLGTSVPGKGGQSGSSASGGAGSGGVFAEGGSGGASQASGGSAAGGTTSTGGILAAGGRGGGNAGGGATGGIISAGGSTVLGGRGGSNAGGSTVVGGRGGSNAGGTGGAGGATSCSTLVACPAIACLYGNIPNPDPCGCPTCAPADAGPETKADATKLACVDMDECSCRATDNCRVLSSSCYCPFPQCGSGACVCGGGEFLGCAPTNLATCADAKTRVARLCPNLKGATFDNLCSQTNTACITWCLDDVTSCGDVGCAFCEGCDCATDNFLTCVGKCNAGLVTK